MFILDNQEVKAGRVSLLRICSHAVSFSDKLVASLIAGLFSGQVTCAGAYPPDGEFGNARFIAANCAPRASPATISGESSRNMTAFAGLH
jgi:hypothetical protein